MPYERHLALDKAELEEILKTRKNNQTLSRNFGEVIIHSPTCSSLDRILHKVDGGAELCYTHYIK